MARFSISSLLQQRLELRNRIVSRLSWCEWAPEEECATFPRVNQKSNGLHGEFVLYNANVLYESHNPQAALDTLDRYVPWCPESPSTLEQIRINEVNLLRGKLHRFCGHFHKARECLERIQCPKYPETSLICKAVAHLAAVYCELGQPRQAIHVASAQLEHLTSYRSRESGSGKRLRLALAYAYLMDGIWFVFNRPASDDSDLSSDIQEGVDKSCALFQELVHSYEHINRLSRSGGMHQISTLFGLASVAHLRGNLPEARDCYESALTAARDCNWSPGFIEAIIHWSQSALMHSFGDVEQAQKRSELAESLYSGRLYFFLGTGTIWPEIIGRMVDQQGRERAIPSAEWEMSIS